MADYTHFQIESTRNGQETAETWFGSHDFKPILTGAGSAAKPACDYTKWPEVKVPPIVYRRRLRDPANWHRSRSPAAPRRPFVANAGLSRCTEVREDGKYAPV